MDLQLQDKGVLVLAASRGLGKAMALAFAREGARVAMFSRSLEDLRQAQQEIAETAGREPLIIAGDLRRTEDIEKAVQITVDACGGIYTLVNNTGGPPAGPLVNFSDRDWLDAFELTLLSYIRSIRLVLPAMRTHGGGRIVNNASASMRMAIDGLGLSNTFRTGIMGLTKSLARELGAVNILVNAIGAGRIDTERLASLDRLKAEKEGVTPEEVRRQAQKTIPLNRYGSPDEFARLAVFLGSPANCYLTGQSILIDGGMSRAY